MTSETDGTKTTTTITCDQWYNEECFKLVVGGPIIVKNIKATLTTYENPLKPKVQNGVIEDVDYGSNYLEITLKDEK